MPNRRRLLALAMAALALTLPSAGCYTRVTDAHGIGADASEPVRHKRTTTIVEDIGNAIDGKDK